MVNDNLKLDGILGGYSLHILQPPLGGVWESSDLTSGKKGVFHFLGVGLGVFWVSSDLNSGKKVRVFHFQGGGVYAKFQNRGVLEKFGQNFLEA